MICEKICHSLVVSTIHDTTATFFTALLLLLGTVQDFLIKLGIKPCMHVLKISLFSLNHVIVRPIKIMNNHLKICKIGTFKVIFRHQKSTESFWFFFSLKYFLTRRRQIYMIFFENFYFCSTLFSENVLMCSWFW